MTLGGLFSRRFHIDLLHCTVLVIGEQKFAVITSSGLSVIQKSGQITNDYVVILDNETFK